MTGDLPVELKADDESEFCRLIVKLSEYCGLTGGQLAVRTGIARSQIYNLISPVRTSLPTKREQVQKLAVAFGLSTAEVAQLLDLWMVIALSKKNQGRDETRHQPRLGRE